MRHRRHVRQETANMGDPRQMAAWALYLAPTIAGSGAITHPHILADWSAHLHACGFRHVDEIRKLADENGMIHVDKLPKQRVKLVPAKFGQPNGLNASARWVPIDDPDAQQPEPEELLNVDEMSAIQREALWHQLRYRHDHTDFYAPGSP